MTNKVKLIKRVVRMVFLKLNIFFYDVIQYPGTTLSCFTVDLGQCIIWVALQKHTLVCVSIQDMGG